MSDRAAVEETLAKFMWARDSQDWAACEAVLSEDCVYISGSPTGDGTKSRTAGRDTFMQVLKMNAMSGLVSSVQHHQSNLVTGFDGDDAWAKAYQLRYLSVDLPDLTGIVESGAFASYKLRRTGGQWLIVECETETQWTKNTELLGALMAKMSEQVS